MSATAMIPRLICRNAAEAAGFYQKAFGAEKVSLMQLPDGTVMHGEFKIDNATFYVVDEMPQHGANSPLALTGTPVTIYLRVADSDAAFNQAVAAGCTVQLPIQDMFWGDRYGMVVDPYGHKWEIATTVRSVSPEELKAFVAGMAERCPAATN